jgi:hypothetical protein
MDTGEHSSMARQIVDSVLEDDINSASALGNLLMASRIIAADLALPDVGRKLLDMEHELDNSGLVG